MRTFFAAFLTVSLVLSTSSCSWIPSQDTHQNIYSEEKILSYTENDSFDTITEAGPLYAGNQSFDDPDLKKYQEQKHTLIDTIIQKTSKANTDAESFAAELKVVKDRYIEYLGQTLALNSKLGKQMKEMVKDIIEPEVQYTANFALLRSMTSDIKNKAAKSMFEYKEVSVMQDNIMLLTRDMAQTTSGLIALDMALTASDKPELKKIALAMEAEIPGLIDSLGTKLSTLQSEGVDIAFQFKKLDTAEYYMGMASVQNIETILASAKTSLDVMQTKEGVSADDIAFFKQLASAYSDFSSEIKKELGTVDQTKLISVQEKSFILPIAHAEEEGYASKALNIFTSAAKSTYEGAKTVGSLTWTAAKSTFNAGKTITGVTVDTIGAVTKTGFDVIYGAANGNTVTEIATEVGSNFKKVGENYTAGKSGSETMKTATGYFEGVEKGAGKVAAGAVESTLGKGWTSWAAGHVGQLTANMVVSFGKGVSKVADTQATTGEIIEGGLDIGLSFIGGSKVLVKGSQVASGSKEAVKLLGEKGVNFLGKILHGGDLKTLKGVTAEILTKTKLTPAEVNQLISNSLSIECKEGIMQELKTVGKNLNDEFLKLLKGGGTTVLENATVGAKESYKEFVKDMFENSLKGYKDAILGILGKDFTAFADNLVATKADDMIKEIIKDYVDKGVIPGIPLFPDLKDIGGSWNGGTMTITDVIASEEFKNSKEGEGCDISSIEKQKGVPKPMDFTFTPTSDTGGTMTIRSADGKPQTAPFTYKDGKIDAAFDSNGASIKMNMNVDEGKDGYTLGGTLDMNFAGLQIKANTAAKKPITK